MYRSPVKSEKKTREKVAVDRSEGVKSAKVIVCKSAREKKNGHGLRFGSENVD